MFVLLQIASAALGMLLVSWSIFLYEGEERVIDETLAAWWIEVDDFAQTAVKRNLAMLRIAARAVSGWLDGVFGERLVSVRAVSASLTLSMASLFLVAFVTSLLDLLKERSNVVTDLIGVLLVALLSAALFYIAVAPGRSTLRVALATGIVLFLCLFGALGRYLVGWSGFEVSAIPMAVTLGKLCTSAGRDAVENAGCSDTGCMGNQQTFSGLAWKNKGKVTRREQFLSEMDAIIPWERLRKLLEPYYPKAGRGRQPLGLNKMLRIYFLQLWFDLSDPQAEDAIYDSESMRRFAGVELSEDAIPDETTILRFRHLLEQNKLTERMFAEINGLLEGKGLLLRSGTIVDATIIATAATA